MTVYTVTYHFDTSVGGFSSGLVGVFASMKDALAFVKADKSDSFDQYQTREELDQASVSQGDRGCEVLLYDDIYRREITKTEVQ